MPIMWRIRRTKPLFTVAIIAVITLLQQQVVGNECSSTCGTPSGLEFCSHISFPVCSSEFSFDDLDHQAHETFNKWSNNASNTLLSKIPTFYNKSVNQLQSMITTLDLTNTSSSCGNFLQRLQCAIQLPVCEIGQDFTRVCEKSCKENAKKHCPLLEPICHSYTSNEVESKGKCFKLEYNGPAVGMWVAGFTISLVFSILNSIGINLQKLSMTRNDASDDKKGIWGQPLWVLGFGLVVLGSLLDFVAFGMAPQTLLAPLAALSLVWNMFIAPIFHKEKVTRYNIMATVIIFAGVTLTVIFAGHSTPSYELQDLIRLYRQPAMYAYMILIAGFLSGLLYCTKYIERTHQYEGGIYHIICYGGIAGTFGGQSVLLAKSTVELLKSAIWGESGSYMFTHMASYVIVIGLGTCLYFQVKFLNGGLARFDALVVIPVYQSFWILTSVLGGIMYFEEYVNMTPTAMFVFTLGGCITIGGIIFLLQTRQGGSFGGGNGEQYTELDLPEYHQQAVTPISAWNADDSDEEEVIQLKTHNKVMMEEEQSKPSVLKSVSSSNSIQNKKVADASMLRSSNAKTTPYNGSKKNRDDDDYM